MRIGEIATLAGVTPRAVRHYHHLGLLPEPERLANGYRDYDVRHAVILARIRRLTELGLALPEVRDALADDAGRELAEILQELDDDLARQETVIAERRGQLRALLAQARAGRLPAEGPVSPGLAELLTAFSPGDSPSAAKDREHLVLLDCLAPPEERDRLLEELRRFADDPGLARGVRKLYGRLDELAEAGADDPRIGPLADAFVACVPDAVLELISGAGGPGDGGDAGGSPGGHAFGEALLDDFAPAQAEVLRRVMTAMTERARRLR